MLARTVPQNLSELRSGPYEDASEVHQYDASVEQYKNTKEKNNTLPIPSMLCS